MNSVERVRQICKERKIPISRLEGALGFSNGYIGQLKKGVFPSDRLQRIAEFLEVPVSSLLDDEQQKKPTPEFSDSRSRLIGYISDKEAFSEEEVEAWLKLLERAKK